MELPAAAVRRIEPAKQVTVLTGTIDRNVPLARTLRGAIPPAALHELVEVSRPIYDLARVSAGQPFELALGANGLLRAFAYGIDELRTLKVVRREGELEAEVVTRSYDTEMVTVAGVIESSLFAALQTAGEHDQLALDLAEIFSWDVDFNTEIQRGDTFRVSVERLSLDGEFRRYGRIAAASFTRGDRELRAIWFEGKTATGYYAPDGRPLRKAFLRSPLRFSRISSRFTRARFHPVLHTMRPHLGVDYAAAVGTPVMASGDGVVTLAGWQGGYGKTVRLRHPNGYETLYGHLSRIDVRRGQRVSQGMTLGAVGSTGLSTGPHLDYRMIRGGVFVDPLKIESPPAEPVPQAERAAFERIRDAALGRMAGTSRAPAAVAAAGPAL